MKSEMEGITPKSAVTSFLYTLLFNTIIAVLLTAIDFGRGFVINFVISQSIGLSICFCVMVVHHFLHSAKPIIQAVLVAAALIVGTVTGSFLGTLVAGLNPLILFEIDGLFFQLLLLGVMFGSIITYIFKSREQISVSETRMQEEKIKRLTSEKIAAEANLKLLQAQIEPHFLFNTLSNVLSLLDTDTEKGKSMLMDFVRYLRTSLSKIREDTTTLGQEIELIRAYLNIYKVRMGDRLRYNIDIPASMGELPIPPMLIQPLVENAIKHGLEPKVEGGEILIAGEEKNGIFRLQVVDTGLGFRQERHSGMGLSNIQERLASLYGDRSQLILEENQPCGLKATIEVPHGKA